MKKVAYVDNQLMALEFNSGDIVQRGGLHDFFLTPYMGRVIVSNPDTGRIQVQWPWGIEEETPTELIRVNPDNATHIPPLIVDQSYSTWDMSRHMNDEGTLKADEKWRKKLTASENMTSRVIRRYEKRTMPIWREACKSWHCGETEINSFKRLSSLFSDRFGEDAVRITIANLYGTGRKLAIYWKDSNRKYKVTKQEQESGKLACPRCKSTLKSRVYKHGGKLFQCASCGFCIKQSDLI